MNRLAVTKELVRIAKSLMADMGSKVWGFQNDIEFAVDIIEGTLEIGMGGEWWGGRYKMGKNVFRHRKESVDPAYVPVTVYVSKKGHAIQFVVMGGFYGASGTIFTLSMT